MKILIMGTGGIGGYYGGRLAEIGADVFFVARGAHLEALKKQGLTITSPAGNLHLDGLKVSSDPQDAGEVEVVILATKAWDVEEAARLVKPLLKKEGFIVHFQNGIDIADQIAKSIDRSQIVGGISYGVVQILKPAHIDHSTKVHSLTYGPFQMPAPPLLNPFHQLCQRAKFEAKLVDKIEEYIWSKFLFICAYSGITSLLRLPIGPIMEDPDTRTMYEACMTEIFNLARAKGIYLPSNLVQDRLEFSMKALEASSTSSMQRDFAAGRRTELISLNAAVSRMGKELGIATPVNDFIYAAMKLHDSQFSENPQPS